MNKETGKQVWIAPKLEKIEMVDTACGNAMGMKNNDIAESGQCGSGPAS